MLVMHVLKRSAGIGAGTGKMEAVLGGRIQELAEAFMVIIMATGFLEVCFTNHQWPSVSRITRCDVRK
jgi:nuclear pore complex protein Nup205